MYLLLDLLGQKGHEQDGDDNRGVLLPPGEFLDMLCAAAELPHPDSG